MPSSLVRKTRESPSSGSGRILRSLGRPAGNDQTVEGVGLGPRSSETSLWRLVPETAWRAGVCARDRRRLGL